VSSALLYVAIVIMWLGVLVPMWLRRDKNQLVEAQDEYVPAAVDDDTGTLTMPVPDVSTASEAGIEGGAEASCEGDTDPADGPELSEEAVPAPQGVPMPAHDPRRAERRRRAVIVARRRRRLFWCTLLILASVVTAAVGVIPWWGVAPSGVLMLGYLTVLRVAVSIDRERERFAAEARAKRARRAEEHRRALELAAQQHEAEIIELAAHLQDELFDQYAELPRRAVGD
jgi:hypothetical protein